MSKMWKIFSRYFFGGKENAETSTSKETDKLLRSTECNGDTIQHDIFFKPHHVMDELLREEDEDKQDYFDGDYLNFKMDERTKSAPLSPSSDTQEYYNFRNLVKAAEINELDGGWMAGENGDEKMFDVLDGEDTTGTKSEVQDYSSEGDDFDYEESNVGERSSVFRESPIFLDISSDESNQDESPQKEERVSEDTGAEMENDVDSPATLPSMPNLEESTYENPEVVTVVAIEMPTLEKQRINLEETTAMELDEEPPEGKKTPRISPDRLKITAKQWTEKGCQTAPSSEVDTGTSKYQIERRVSKETMTMELDDEPSTTEGKREISPCPLRTTGKQWAEKGIQTAPPPEVDTGTSEYHIERRVSKEKMTMELDEKPSTPEGKCEISPCPLRTTGKQWADKGCQTAPPSEVDTGTSEYHIERRVSKVKMTMELDEEPSTSEGKCEISPCPLRTTGKQWVEKGCQTAPPSEVDTGTSEYHIERRVSKETMTMELDEDRSTPERKRELSTCALRTTGKQCTEKGCQATPPSVMNTPNMRGYTQSRQMRIVQNAGSYIVLRVINEIPLPVVNNNESTLGLLSTNQNSLGSPNTPNNDLIDSRCSPANSPVPQRTEKAGYKKLMDVNRHSRLVYDPERPTSQNSSSCYSFPSQNRSPSKPDAGNYHTPCNTTPTQQSRHLSDSGFQWTPSTNSNGCSPFPHQYHSPIRQNVGNIYNILKTPPIKNSTAAPKNCSPGHIYAVRTVNPADTAAVSATRNKKILLFKTPANSEESIAAYSYSHFEPNGTKETVKNAEDEKKPSILREIFNPGGSTQTSAAVTTEKDQPKSNVSQGSSGKRKNPSPGNESSPKKKSTVLRLGTPRPSASAKSSARSKYARQLRERKIEKSYKC